MEKLYLNEIIAVLSFALDLTEGQPAGHSIRSCWIGFHIAESLSLSDDHLQDIYYTLLLKDAGCSSNSARLCNLYGTDDRLIKQNFKLVNNDEVSAIAKFVLSHTGLNTTLAKKYKKLLNLIQNGKTIYTEITETRCERGAEIAKLLGLSERVARGIYSLDEHYNGRGQPHQLSKLDIPLASRIALLAQVIDVFHTASGKQNAINEALRRSGTWFDPDLVSAFIHVAKQSDFWAALSNPNISSLVTSLEKSFLSIPVTEDYLDNISSAFGQIVDAKSPFTSGHSHRVGQYASAIAEDLGFNKSKTRVIFRAAILHDLGKLGVSNTILDKPGKLTEQEWVEMKKHSQLTEEILSKLKPFEQLASITAAHHERLDGKGYFRGLQGDSISTETRIITVADIFDALTADRPYRAAMPLDKALDIMNDMRKSAIDDSCMNSLESCLLNKSIQISNISTQNNDDNNTNEASL